MKTQSKPVPLAARAALLLVVVPAAAFAFTQKAGRESGTADTILTNGHVYTSNPLAPWAEAVAIRGDQILTAGSSKEINAYKTPRTTVINLAGRMAMPGIIDTHTHFREGSDTLAGVQISGATSVEEVQARVRAFAASHPNEKWVYGAGWDYGSFWPSGLPTKEILDQVEPNRPVAIISSDTHSVWVNSRALALAKISRDTPDPGASGTGSARGIIVRDAKSGEPTGVLEEGARSLVLTIIPTSHAEQLHRIHLGMAYANQHGITSVINASGDIPEMELYEELHERGESTVRTATAFAQDVGIRHTMSPDELAQFEEARRKFRGDWVRAGIVKFFADGVIETHTAAMLAPYANAPGESGQTLYTPDEFKKYFLELDKRGFQVMTHAVGDRTVRDVLDAYEAVEKQDGPRDRRWRIEHLEVVAASDRPRLAQLHTIAAIQPWCCASLDEPWGAGVGAARMADGIPWQDIVSPGATLIMGSDWPVEPLDPFAILQTGLTRQTPDGQPAGGFFPKQALTLDQMLAGYTRNAAYSEFMEDRIGSLEPGKLADVIVLSQDLYKVAPTSVGKTTVLLTMVGGKIVWRSGI